MGKFKTTHLKYLQHGKKKLMDRARELQEELQEIKEDIDHIEQVENSLKR